MKRLASQLSLIIAALAATPAALAGSDILKCVDGAGHVTLTDQPCESGRRWACSATRRRRPWWSSNPGARAYRNATARWRATSPP